MAYQGSKKTLSITAKGKNISMSNEMWPENVRFAFFFDESTGGSTTLTN